MNARSSWKRIAIGALSLGLSGSLLLGASAVQARQLQGPNPAQSGSDTKAPEMKQSPPLSSPEPREQHRGGKRIFLMEDAAQVIGIEKQELWKQLREGKSMVEVAKTKGMTEEKLIEGLTASYTKRLSEMVQSGKLPQEKADHMKAKLPEHVKMMVNRKDWKELEEKWKNREHPSSSGKNEKTKP